MKGQELLFSAAKTILVVEDDLPMGDVIQLTLSEDASWYSIVITDPRQVMNFMRSNKVDLLLIDYLLPGMSGVDLYDQIHAEMPSLPTVIMSASLFLHRREIEERNLVGLEKPFELDQLLDMVKTLLT